MCQKAVEKNEQLKWAHKFNLYAAIAATKCDDICVCMCVWQLDR